jgi:hypothetical protein
MTPGAWCDWLAQQKTLERKKRVRVVPGEGYYRVYLMRPRKEVGPYPDIESAWLADNNLYRAAENYTQRRLTYEAD